MNEWISPHQSPAAKMTPERILEAGKTLKKYKAGKARLEARLIADESGMITKIDGLLTLKGLNNIYQRNFMTAE